MEKMISKTWFIVYLAVFTVMVLGSYTYAEEEPQRGGTFKIISNRVTKVLGAPWEADPRFSIYGAPTMETLVRLDKEGNIIPHLATSWEMAADGKSYTFKLRKGVKFHDGTDFNADAVKFCIEEQKTGVTALRLESIHVIDEYTVKINLKQNDSTFLIDLASRGGMIASPTAASKKTTSENMARDHMVGTGPYTFVSWSRDEYIQYKRFDGYWQKGKPYPDAMEFRFIQDPVTSVLAFQSGAAQLIMSVQPKDAKELKAKGYEILSLPVALKALSPDSANADSPWANRMVREALSHAIDRNAIAESIGLGLWWDPAYQVSPYKGWAGHLDNIEGRKYDTNLAKKLLAEAGYPNGFETTIIGRSQDGMNMLVALQGDLANIGIKARVELVDLGRYVSLHEKGWHNGIFYNSFGFQASDKYFNMRALAGMTSRHRSVYRPAGFIEGYNKAANALTPDDVNKYTEELFRNIYDESVIVPLWVETQLAVQTKKIHDSGWCEISPFLWYPENAWLSK